jgi:hypothetical protein
MWSAAVSAEDQPQHGKKGGGWGTVPRRSEDVRAQRLVLRTSAVQLRKQEQLVGRLAFWRLCGEKLGKRYSLEDRNANYL